MSFFIDLSSDKSIDFCLDFALKIKQNEVKQTTYKDYKNRINQFKKFLTTQELLYKPIKELHKQHVTSFLKQFKGKNRNNIKIVLSTIFSTLSDENYIEFNFIKEIKTLKTQPQPITLYTQKDIEKITKLLHKHDYTLLLFIKLVSYMFLRPVEIFRIKIENINFENKTITIPTKTKSQQTKIIPTILFQELKTFAQNKNNFLFKPNNFTEWNLNDNDKRNYFTRRFARFRKKFNIDNKFKLYSFRHTYITKIYLELRKTKSKEETIKELSLITGHQSKAIHNYIQVNDIELPKDYSHYLTF